MPYILSFIKNVKVTDPEQYINDCCVGGDLVLSQLLSLIEEQYDDLQSGQEDWGWYAWFKHANTKLEIDIHTHDTSIGEFTIHLTSRKLRLLLLSKIQDTPELDILKESVVSILRSWCAEQLVIERVNEKYMPL